MDNYWWFWSQGFICGSLFVLIFWSTEKWLCDIVERRKAGK